MADTHVRNSGIRKLLLSVIPVLVGIILVFLGAWITRVEDAVKISIAVQQDMVWIRQSLTTLNKKIDAFMYPSSHENRSQQIYD